MDASDSPVFSRTETARIRQRFESTGAAECPRCGRALDEVRVEPHPVVSYVRRRRWLHCPECGRSALVEARRIRQTPTELPVVGWREWVALPELGAGPVKAKIDTGARTSALHAIDLHEIDAPDGVRFLEFTILPEQRTDEGAVRSRALLIDSREVRSSSGEARLRPVIRTPVTIGRQTFSVEFTLTRRDRMGFRMLIGRTALRNRFRVDPARSFVQADPHPNETTP